MLVHVPQKKQGTACQASGEGKVLPKAGGRCACAGTAAAVKVSQHTGSTCFGY